MSKNPPRVLFFLFIVAGFTGLLDSVYLTIEHYRGDTITCGIFGGCQKVVTSPYATIAGFPVSLLGVFYYLFILLLVVVLREVWEAPPEGRRGFLKRLTLLLIPVFTAMGFLFTLRLLYLMFFVIKAACIYCLGSALSSTVLFFLGICLFRLKSLNNGSNCC